MCDIGTAFEPCRPRRPSGTGWFPAGGPGQDPKWHGMAWVPFAVMTPLNTEALPVLALLIQHRQWVWVWGSFGVPQPPEHVTVTVLIPRGHPSLPLSASRGTPVSTSVVPAPCALPVTQ